MIYYVPYTWLLILQSAERVTHISLKVNQKMILRKLTSSRDFIETYRYRTFYNNETFCFRQKKIELARSSKDKLDIARTSLTLLEIHVDLDLPGFESEDDGIKHPYIVTIR